VPIENKTGGFPTKDKETAEEKLNSESDEDDPENDN
jgi:hypothetical protein